MEKLSRLSLQNHNAGARGRAERREWRGHGHMGHEESSGSRISGSLDKEIDLSGHYNDIAAAAEAVRKGREVRDQQGQRTRGGAKEVEGGGYSDEEVPGPFTYASGKSVLDPSPRFPGDLSNNSHNDDIGGLIVSRVGRYD